MRASRSTAAQAALGPAAWFRVALPLLAAAALLAAVPARARIVFSAAEPVPVSPRPEFMAVGDLNGDGRDDLVVVSTRSNEVAVLLGASSSPTVFLNVQVYPVGRRLRGVAVGDLDEDGIPDIIVADETGRALWALPGRGDGSFAEALSVLTGGHPFAVAIGDFDAASGQDLAVADRRSGDLTVLVNDGQKRMRFLRGPRFDAGEGVDQVVVGDLDGDGRPDIACLQERGRRGNDLVVMYLQGQQGGMPVFTDPLQVTVGIGRTRLGAADFNRDARIDIVLLNDWRRSSGSSLEVMLSNTGRSFSDPEIVELRCPQSRGHARCRPRALAAGDFDLDGRADIAVAQRDPRRLAYATAGDSDSVVILRARGDGSLVDYGIHPGPRHPLAAVSGDFNGDGLPDVAVAGKKNQVQVLINYSDSGMTADGDPCLLGDECSSGLCTNGVCCADLCAAGERCDLPGHAGICTAP